MRRAAVGFFRRAPRAHAGGLIRAMHIRISLPQQTLELHDERRHAAAPLSRIHRQERRRRAERQLLHAARPAYRAGKSRRWRDGEYRVRAPPADRRSLDAANWPAQFPGRDWILTRILWLSGREPGRNRLGEVDTMRRYIYLHGTPDTVPMGAPGSIGCVRMRNSDIIELFDLVPPYTPVDIVEFGVEAGSWTELARAGAPGARGGVRRRAGRSAGHGNGRARRRQPPRRCHSMPTGGAIGTGRLLARTATSAAWRCCADWRGKGVGRALLERLLEEAGHGREQRQLALHAQTQASGFYRRFGFVEEGPEFMEAGIPHRTMVRSS